MKKTVSATMLTLLLITTLTLAFHVPPAKAEPKTIYVDDDNTGGPWDGTPEHPYRNITSGIEHSSAGDTIFVHAGTYLEHVIVDKTVSLIGEGPYNTVIDGGGTESVLVVTQNDVTIKGFKVQNSGVDWLEAVILLNGSRGNTIKNNIIQDTECGINLRYGASGNTINENSIVSKGSAISSEPGYNYLANIVTNNTMRSDTGIVLLGSYGNKIAGNNLTAIFPELGYYENCIHIFGGADNIIVDNIISHVGWEKGGIALWSDNDTVIRNIIEYYPEVGIGIWGSGSTIIGNNLTNPLAATYQQGIHLSGSSNILVGNTIANNVYGVWISSSENHIYHNNFINNVNQVYFYGTLNNSWDNSYPSGGNYWSNYTGADLNSGPNQDIPGSDGISDSPYVVDANNMDTFPLMGPISFFDAGTWNEITYYVDTVSNSTVSDFYFSENYKLVRFDVTGPNDTVGFCRVTIPNELVWCDNPEQWQVWVNNTLIEDKKVIEDTNCTYIYFSYNQSTQNVEIIGVHVIPEFPTWTSMLLVLTVFTVAIAVYKRRLMLQSIKV